MNCLLWGINGEGPGCSLSRNTLRRAIFSNLITKLAPNLYFHPMNPKSPADLYILAVEDDPLYAESLELVLHESGYQAFSIVDNATDALKLFKDKAPDIILMDIEINGPLNGIEFVEIISAIRPTPVIYVTAFTDAGTFNRAKLTKPSAYIVKPYHATALQAAIELALLGKDGVNGNGAAPDENNAAVHAGALFVKYNSRLIKLCVPDLLFIEVDEKYCHIHTAGKRYAVNIRLKNLLELLPANAFIQTHRSFAVRLDAVEEVNLEDSLLKIKGKDIPIGKTYRDAFFAKLKMI